MKNVQQLLDELGSPPTEISLDWAWQLLSLIDSPNSPATFQWSDLQISPQGALYLSLGALKPSEHGPSEATGRPTLDQLRQLLSWSGLEDSQLQKIDTIDACRFALEELIRQHQEQTSPSQSANLTTAAMSPARLDHGSKERIAEKTPSQVGARRHSDSRNHLKRIAAIATATTLLITIAAILFNRISDRQRKELALNQPSKTSDSPTDIQASDQAQNKSSRAKASKPKAQVNELDDLLSGSSDSRSSSSTKSGTNNRSPRTNADETPELNSLSSSVSERAELSALSIESPSVPNLQPSADSTPASGALSTIVPSLPSATDSWKASSGSNDATAPTTTTKDAQSTDDAMQPTTTEFQKESPSSQESVAELLKSVTPNDTQVNALDAGEDAQGTPKIPLQLLNVESMSQVQQLPTKVRVREPVWQLRVSSTTAFSVDPPGLQSLAEKQTVRWILTAKELKPRKGQEPTQVVVLAQLASRRADIRWTIAAGSPDLPGIALPLDEKTLDKMLTVLQGYQQRLNASIDQIKSTLELTDFPKDRRSFMTTQRRTLENEGKLVTRVRQMIADASMFASWMDRSLEVHGVLTDQVGGQSNALLEMGQPILPKPLEGTSDSNEDARLNKETSPVDQ